MKTPSLLSTLDEFPPCVIRMVAREPGRKRIPATLDSIAERSGLAKGYVQYMATLTSWATVEVGVVDQFLKGCGFTFSDWAAIRKYVKRSMGGQEPFAHLSHPSVRNRQRAAIARAVKKASEARCTPSTSSSSAG